MEATIAAILARFNGNRALAIKYCAATADQYPHLRKEYTQLLCCLLTK